MSSPRLVAVDLPGGPAFVEELQRIWEAGDAALPVDQRLPATAKAALCAALRVGEPVEPGDALVMATSGSTGSPKGVVLTHAAIGASAAATSERLGVTADDHWLACLPLAHVGGLSVVTRALHTGTALTVLPGFDADAVRRCEASWCRSSPPRSRASRRCTIPDDRARRKPSSGGSTGQLCHHVRHDRDREWCGVRRGAARWRRGRHRRRWWIRLRGPMLLRCYRDGSSPFDLDGWMATGDLGAWRPDGRLEVQGRRSELIITGGENVWPEAVEAALADHPGVVDVMVRGVDDLEWGQLVEAVVVPAADRPTLDELRAHVKAHHPAFMAPKRLTFATSLPRTALGKPRRHAR